MGFFLPHGPTDFVASVLSAVVQAGDRVLDATAGNGHDTLHLARLVGEEGRVWALDVQAAAIDSSRRRLEEAGVAARVCLIQGDHAELDTLLPAELAGRLRAVVFNLGYLPGGDRDVISTPDSTVAALEAAAAWLAPGGLLAVTVYPGHEGGQREAAAVDTWVAARPRRSWTAWSARVGNAAPHAPRTHLIQSRDGGEAGA